MVQVVTRRGIRVATDLRKGLILVKAPYEAKDVLRGIPGAVWARGLTAWTYPMSPMSAERIRSALEGFPEYEIHADEAFLRLEESAVSLREASGRKTEEEVPQPPVCNLPAWKHQARGFWFAHDVFRAGGRGVMLAMDMGTGKSRTTIDIIQNTEGIRRVMILCPLSVVSVWPEEFRKHAAIPFRVIRLAENWSVAKKAEVMAEYLDAPGRIPLVFVCNYESAWRDPLGPLILSQSWDYAVCDESHRIKSPDRTARASKFCEALAKVSARRLALTGTPLPHSPMDAFAQYRFLDPSIFGPYFSGFRSRFAIMGGFGGKEIIGYKNEAEFNRLFYSIAYRVGKDVLDLPPAVHSTRECVLEASAMNTYRKIERQFYAELEAGEITASNALTKLLRLQQIACGWVKTDDGSLVEISRAKRKVLQDVLEDLPEQEPVVVFCRFRSDLDTVHAVARELGRKSLELSGGVNELERWQKGEAPILAVQIQAGGVGISLVRARYCIYYSKGFSLGDYEQSLARVHRPGQGESVTYLHLVAKGTVDEKVERALRDRRDVVEAILSQSVVGGQEEAVAEGAA